MQETDFRRCSASDQREVISREHSQHRSFRYLLSCPKPRFTSGSVEQRMETSK